MQKYLRQMNHLFLASFFGMFTAVNLLPVASYAQAKQESVATFKDWAVFTGDVNGQKVCYIASSPKKSEANKPNVRRGDIFLMVANRPADNVQNEISFASGYPLKPQSVVSVIIDSSNYEMFVQGESAWTPSAEEDQKVIASMRAGTNAVVKGVSSRGTRTTDTFSLLGFTDALADAQKRCS
jgi:hypothetical protein